MGIRLGAATRRARAACARCGPFNYSSNYLCASWLFPVPRITCSSCHRVGVGLDRGGSAPTSILRVAPSRGGALALIQVNEWSEFHRRPGSSHSLVAPFHFTPRRRMWQRCQQHERGPIKERTRVAVDDHAPSATWGTGTQGRLLSPSLDGGPDSSRT